MMHCMVGDNVDNFGWDSCTDQMCSSWLVHQKNRLECYRRTPICKVAAQAVAFVPVNADSGDSAVLSGGLYDLQHQFLLGHLSTCECSPCREPFPFPPARRMVLALEE